MIPSFIHLSLGTCFCIWSEWEKKKSTGSTILSRSIIDNVTTFFLTISSSSVCNILCNKWLEKSINQPINQLWFPVCNELREEEQWLFLRKAINLYESTERPVVPVFYSGFDLWPGICGWWIRRVHWTIGSFHFGIYPS